MRENTKEYYILLCDADRGDLEAVDDYEFGGFDLTLFWTGDVFEGLIPKEVKIRLGEGKPSDLLGNPMSWLIISKRLRAILEPICQAEVQFIPVTLWTRNKPNNRYLLANPIGCVDAIASKKRQPSIQTLQLNLSKIPIDRHLFRLKRLETTYIISPTLFEALKDKGLEGLAARRVIVS